MRDMVRIRCDIEWPDGKLCHLDYAIGMEQARELNLGRPPPEFDALATSEWMRLRQRADALAQFIGTDLAHKLVRSLGPSGAGAGGV